MAERDFSHFIVRKEDLLDSSSINFNDQGEILMMGFPSSSIAV